GNKRCRNPEGGSLGWADSPTGVGHFPREGRAPAKDHAAQVSRSSEFRAVAGEEPPSGTGSLMRENTEKPSRFLSFLSKRWSSGLESGRLNCAAALRMISSLTRKPQVAVIGKNGSKIVDFSIFERYTETYCQ